MRCIETAVGQSELGAVARWAVGIGGGAAAHSRMVGFASCKPADALVLFFVWFHVAD